MARPGPVGLAWINGAAAGRIDSGTHGSTAVSLVVEGGRITRIYAVRNPATLTRLERETPLAR